MWTVIIAWAVIALSIVAGLLRFIALTDERNEHGFPASRKYYRDR